MDTHVSRPETLRATLDLQAPVEAQLDLWLNGLMNQISQRSAVPLARQAAPKAWNSARAGHQQL